MPRVSRYEPHLMNDAALLDDIIIYNDDQVRTGHCHPMRKDVLYDVQDYAKDRNLCKSALNIVDDYVLLFLSIATHRDNLRANVDEIKDSSLEILSSYLTALKINSSDSEVRALSTDEYEAFKKSLGIGRLLSELRHIGKDSLVRDYERVRGDDRDYDRRDDRGYRRDDRGRDRDRDDRRDDRGYRNDRMGIGGRDSRSRLSDREPVLRNQPAQQPQPQQPTVTKNIGVKVMQRNASVFMLPQLPSHCEMAYDNNKPQAYRTVYHANTQLPVFVLSSAPSNTNTFDIVGERILALTDPSATEIINNFESNIRGDDMTETHLNYLMFDNKMGISDRDINTKRTVQLLDNVLSQVVEVGAGDINNVFNPKMDVNRHYHIKGIHDGCTSDYYSDMLCLVAEKLESGEGITGDDVAYSAIINSVFPLSANQSKDLDAVLNQLKGRRAHNTIIESMTKLRSLVRPAMWTTINDAFTNFINEVVTIEMNIGVSISNYYSDMLDLLQYVMDDYGQTFADALAATASRMLNCAINIDVVGDAPDENPRWVLSQNTLVMRLPCNGAELDIAIANNQGTGIVSALATPGLSEVLLRLFDYAQNCRRIVIVTNDNAKLYVYKSPIGNATIISKYINDQLVNV